MNYIGCVNKLKKLNGCHDKKRQGDDLQTTKDLKQEIFGHAGVKSFCFKYFSKICIHKIGYKISTTMMDLTPLLQYQVLTYHLSWICRHPIG